MLRRMVSLAIVCMVLAAASAEQPATTESDPAMPRIPAPDKILSTLKPQHPRLLVGDGGFERIAKLIQADKVAGQWYAKIRREANEILDAPVASYDIPDGKRLLGMSRTVVERMYALALVYRMTGEAKYLERAWRDMNAVAAFPDWNPSHFLDTAEMTHACAIAYDWLYDAWTPAQRRTLRSAIVKHGLEAAMQGYTGGAWWAKGKNNWNQVCNGGIASGALAIAEDEPKLAADIVHRACKGLPVAMRHFAPDGGWYEGPGYWGYATRYNIMILAALDTALGTDFGLSDMPGLAMCGDFPIYLCGATGYTFNFADARPGRLGGAQFLWLAHRFDRPDYAAVQFQAGRPHPLDLVWFDARGKSADMKRPPLDRLFTGVQVASMRSAWNDPDAVYVGIKAGRNGVSHDNLDLGSFIYEADGVRWAVDLGPDDYNLPAYFGPKRYTYYRIRAEGHNTLLVNPGEGPDQQPKGKAVFTSFDAKPQSATATVDLADVYRPHVTSAERQFRLGDRRRKLAVTDRVSLKEAGEFWWFMHTQAKVAVADDGRSATLTQDGKTLTVKIAQGPAAARFTVMAAQPLPSSPHPQGQNPNNGAKLTNAPAGLGRVRRGNIPEWGKPNAAKAYRKLAIHLSGVRNIELSVSLSPGA